MESKEQGAKSKEQELKQTEGRRRPPQFPPFSLRPMAYSLSSSVLSPQSSVLPNYSAICACWLLLIMLCSLLTPLSAAAQMSGSGWMIHLYGTVQVEPGSDVTILEVKDEKIRFAIQNVHCSDRNFSNGRFMSDVTNRDPGLHVKGSEEWLEMLINERPNKRVLQMSGVYYSGSRLFVINKLARFSGASGLQPR